MTALARVRDVLALAGLDPDQQLQRAASNANEVWLGAAIAIRINHPELIGASPHRLAREAVLGARLPREALYPRIVHQGRDGDLAWLISERVPGVQLGRAWAGMPMDLRERAIHQLVAALDAVHATPCDDVRDDVDPPHTLPLEPLLELVELVVGDPALRDDLVAFARDTWTAFADAPRVLVHGDPHFENVMWDGANVTALLDFEWARPSFYECDLETLLAIADDPALFAAADYEASVRAADYTSIPRWLAAAAPAWFAAPRLVDRLNLLFVSRTLGVLADHPEATSRFAHLRGVLRGVSPVSRLLAPNLMHAIS